MRYNYPFRTPNIVIVVASIVVSGFIMACQYEYVRDHQEFVEIEKIQCVPSMTIENSNELKLIYKCADGKYTVPAVTDNYKNFVNRLLAGEKLEEMFEPQACSISRGSLITTTKVSCDFNT
jgi:hypothetical protein